MSRDWRDPLPAALATTFWGCLGVRDRAILFGAGPVRPLRRGATLCREGQRTILALSELAAARTTGRPVAVRITQQDLADMVAASLVSVTRVLEDLRDLGAVSTGRGRIVLSGPEALTALLPPRPGDRRASERDFRSTSFDVERVRSPPYVQDGQKQ